MEEDLIGNEGPDRTVALQKRKKKKTENIRIKQTVQNS
jgi:hypothetical protein